MCAGMAFARVQEDAVSTLLTVKSSEELRPSSEEKRVVGKIECSGALPSFFGGAEAGS